MSARVRFAPSPTGHLHVGNARTALFNWLFARGSGGIFVLRIEDTDIERQQEGAEEAILEDLAWLGLDWDEGPVPFAEAVTMLQRRGYGAEPMGFATATGAGTAGPGSHDQPGSIAHDQTRGPASRTAAAVGGSAGQARRDAERFGPYRQSERGGLYAAAYETLRAKGLVYPCFCDAALLEADRRAALDSGRTPGYPGRCTGIPEWQAAARVAAGEGHALRFRVGHYGVVEDLFRGRVDFSSRPAFDPVIRRRDRRPTYNFAVVVDDAGMGITHVLRGEDHLTNTALQLRLYESLDLRPPRFGHLPLILGPDGSPLSKRHGATSVSEMRERGYPAEGLVNSLALLGWTPPGDRVVLTRQEVVGLFDLAQVNANPSIFDMAKLDYISGQKIRSMDPADRGREIGRFLREGGLLEKPDTEAGAWLTKVGDLLATGINRFEEVREAARFLVRFEPAEAIAAGALEGEGSRRALEAFRSLLEEAGGAAEGSVPVLIERAKSLTGLKGRALLHPLRAAVTGLESGPELAKILPLIEEAARLQVVRGVAGPAERIGRVLAAA